MRILYVEDNATNVILVQRVANMGKHSVVTYDNGEEALANFEHDAPDCVLLDVQLRGELSGLDVVSKLRERGIRLPIIALTAYAMKGDRQRCIDAGCDDYIPKPISVTELVSVFKRFNDAITSSRSVTLGGGKSPLYKSLAVTEDNQPLADTVVPSAVVKEAPAAAEPVKPSTTDSAAKPTTPTTTVEPLTPAAIASAPSSTPAAEPSTPVIVPAAPLTDEAETKPVGDAQPAPVVETPKPVDVKPVLSPTNAADQPPTVSTKLAAEPLPVSTAAQISAKVEP